MVLRYTAFAGNFALCILSPLSIRHLHRSIVRYTHRQRHCRSYQNTMLATLRQSELRDAQALVGFVTVYCRLSSTFCLFL